MGAALGTSLSLIICNCILINIYYYKVIKLDVIKFWKDIGKQSIPFAIPITIIILLMNFIKLNGIIYLIVYGGIYLIMYCLFAYFISMNKYEKDLVNKLLVKIHLKKV